MKYNMPYSIYKTSKEHDFASALNGTKIPLLVLDQKWHRIFPPGKKPDVIHIPEQKVNELLAQQGRVQQELKELKRLKSNLMNDIVENMEGAEGNSSSSKKLAENKRLINEINEKMDSCEDILLDMPRMLKDANDILMQETMEYCYGKLRTNTTDIEEIGTWIRDIRIELKKQIIRKQNAEIQNREIYSYMHDIFGAQIVDIFDLKYETEEELSNTKKTE